MPTTPVVTYTRGVASYESSLTINITSPNPSPSLVQVDWALNGASTTHPAMHPPGYSSPTTCSWIKGKIISGTYSDEKPAGLVDGAVGTASEWSITLAQGQLVPGTPSAGHFDIRAMCRVQAIVDPADSLTVTVRNWIEFREYHGVILGYSNYDYSLTKAWSLWVKKISP